MTNNNSKQSKNRRAFLRGSLATGAAVMSASALSEGKLFAAPTLPATQGDVNILRFLAAAELIETDMWQQYAELGGLTPGQQPVETDPSFVPMSSYQAAFMNLDPDGPHSPSTWINSAHCRVVQRPRRSKSAA